MPNSTNHSQNCIPTLNVWRMAFVECCQTHCNWTSTYMQNMYFTSWHLFTVYRVMQILNTAEEKGNRSFRWKMETIFAVEHYLGRGSLAITGIVWWPFFNLLSNLQAKRKHFFHVDKALLPPVCPWEAWIMMLLLDIGCIACSEQGCISWCEPVARSPLSSLSVS